MPTKPQTSQIVSRKRVADHGKLLADYAVSTFRFMKEVSAEGVDATTLELEMPVNHSLDHMAEQAKEIQKLWAETSNNKLCAEVRQKKIPLNMWTVDNEATLKKIKEIGASMATTNSLKPIHNQKENA
jgi:glycerophosphoryl diester phosphodiesterase